MMRQPEVTHCYERPTFDDLPYNLYSMVHAADPDAAAGEVRRLAELVGVSDYQMLHTVRELKKSTPIYRQPEE